MERQLSGGLASSKAEVYQPKTGPGRGTLKTLGSKCLVPQPEDGEMNSLSYRAVHEVDVLLINPPYAQRYGSGIVPPMGLAYIAAWLRQNNANVVIADLAAEFQTHDLPDSTDVASVTEEVLQALQNAPRLIGIGPIVTANLRSAHTIAKTCRQACPAPIFVGGPMCAVPGFRAVAAKYLNVDGYVCGDGERPMGDIWQRLTTGDTLVGVEGLGLPTFNEHPAAYREVDLDVLPIPARDLLGEQYRMSARRTVGSAKATSAFLSRGCPYSCSFCSAPLSSGRRIRRFSHERITKEIASCANLGYESIVFYDDCLFVASRDLDNKVHSFTTAIAASGWSGTYQLELRCDAVLTMSETSLNLLNQSGCRQINMGIEKGHKAQLDMMRKRLTPEIAASACARVKSSGIRAAGTFILGGIGEVPDDLLSTIEFACGLDLDFAQFNPLAVYPGTLLFQQLYPDIEDWLPLCLDSTLAPFGDILWRSVEVPLEEIAGSLHFAYESFYSDDRLERTVQKSPSKEGQMIRDSYWRLRNSRALSWSGMTTAQVPTC
jgi:hypothetical protein